MIDPRFSKRTSPRRWAPVIASRSAHGRSDIVLVLLDAALIALAYAAMLVVRYEVAVPTDAWPQLLRFVAVAIVVHLVVNRLAGMYGPVWEQASVEEAQRILLAGAASGALLFAWMVVGPRLVPLSVALTGSIIAIGLMGLLRFQSRLFAFRRRPHGGADTRVLVVGAGESGGALLREISRRSDAAIRVAALLDDDPRKLGRSVGNVPIVGQVDDLEAVGRQLEVEQVILAIPSADSVLVRRVADATARLGVSLKVLPTVSELMNGQPQLRDVRDLSIEDLLGRQSVSTDLASVAAMIHGRRVLVTGGGGSIGSEIVRQISQYQPARLVVVERDETNLFYSVGAVDVDCRPVLLDLRDRRRVDRLFAEETPEIVFHAAADKHVPLLEAQPSEAASNNVLGTYNLVNAARRADVRHLVFVSTDKAVRPTSVMGASKRLGEQLTLVNAPERGAWCAVRFGNVLGSRGSVVPTFMRQISEGGPVTVTHEEMIRYFMSVGEAVQLVLQAAALTEDREVFMLDMGEPVRILDLAQRMISLAGQRVGSDVQIAITGIRPGEKLHEELAATDETPSATSHPKILRLQLPLPEPAAVSQLVERLAEAAEEQDDERVRSLLLDEAEHLARTIDLNDPSPAHSAEPGETRRQHPR